MTSEASTTVRSATRIWAIIFVGLSVAITVFTVYYLRGMAGLLAGFGADLPFLAKLFIDVDAWLLIVPLTGLVPTIALFTNDELPTGRIGLLFGWTVAMPVVTVGLFFLVMFAMYQPIFELGEAI